MRPTIDPKDLSLLVRALHRDVSALDERLRRLEIEIHELRDRAGVPDPIALRVLGSPRGR